MVLTLVIGPIGVDGSANPDQASATHAASITIHGIARNYPRLRKLDGAGNVTATWCPYGTGNGQCNGAGGIAADPSGNTYFTDSGNYRVQVFGPTGSFIRKWGSQGSGPGQFATPYQLDLDASNNVYVADFGNNRIQKFTSTGTFLTQWPVQYAARLAVDRINGYVYADTCSGGPQCLGVMKKYTLDGSFVSSWSLDNLPTPGYPYAQPSDIAVDFQGNVYVGDSSGKRILKFTPNGGLIWATPHRLDPACCNGSIYHQYLSRSCCGLDVDDGGDLWVAAGGVSQYPEPDGEKLSQWSSEGEFIAGFPASSSDPGISLLDVTRLCNPQASDAEWSGPLTESSWLNETQYLDYVIHDCVQRVELKVDGNVVASSTRPNGRFSLDVNQFASGVHNLTLTASFKDTTAVKTNATFRVDHDSPTGTATAPRSADGTVAVSGSIQDLHSGPSTWRPEFSSGGAWTPICTVSAPGPYSCQWNTSQLDEGTYQLRPWMTDLVTNQHSNAGAGASAPLTVDRSAPQLTLSGALPDQDEPGTDLHVHATDGDINSPQTQRSGVRNIELRVDGNLAAQTTAQDCPESSCTQELDYDGSALASGKHTFVVRAWDQLGHQSPDETFSVQIDRPTTGILDEYLLQYVDPPEDAEGNRDDSELAVNVVNGNLIYRHTDARVEGEDIDLTIDRYFNSQLTGGRGTFGNGWTLNGGRDVSTVAQQSGDVAVTGPSAYEGLFVRQPDGSFGPSDELHAAVLKETSQGGYDLTLEEPNYSYHFDSGGVLNSETTENGSSLEYVYSANRLSSARTSEGAEATFSYGPLNLFSKAQEMRIGDETYRYTQDVLNKLTRYTDPAGNATVYAYDVNNRLIEIRHPEGSETRMTYDGQGRVTSVVEAPSASAQSGPTTSFDYGQGATNVTEPNGRATSYIAGKAGFVTRSESGSSLPSLSLGGSLFQNRETSVSPGIYTLDISAVAGANPIKSIEIWADNGQMESYECTASCGSFTAQWELDTSVFLAGDTVVEVFATDTQGRERSRRFEVTIPPVDGNHEQPAPEPTFQERLTEATAYRQRYGLQADPEYVTATLNNPSLASSQDEYGVPLTGAEQDIVDFHHKLDEDLSIVEQYGQDEAGNEYAGAYIDHTDGGRIYVGFTANSNAHMDELEQRFPWPLHPFPDPPVDSFADLVDLSDQITADADELGDEGIVVNGSAIDVVTNRVEVGVAQPSPAVEQQLETRYNADLTVVQQSPALAFRQKPVYGGALMKRADNTSFRCTVAFGARRRLPNLPFDDRRGDADYAYFLLTAGHCGPTGTRFLRGDSGQPLGSRMADNALYSGEGQDGGAIRVNPRLATPFIRVRDRKTLNVKKVQPNTEDTVGKEVCTYGAVSQDKTCGAVTRNRTTVLLSLPDGGTATLRDQRRWVPDRRALQLGDSGAPTFQVREGGVRAVGIFSSGGPSCSQPQDCAFYTYSQIDNVAAALTKEVPMKVLTQPPFGGVWPSP